MLDERRVRGEQPIAVPDLGSSSKKTLEAIAKLLKDFFRAPILFRPAHKLPADVSAHPSERKPTPFEETCPLLLAKRVHFAKQQPGVKVTKEPLQIVGPWRRSWPEDTEIVEEALPPSRG